MQLKNRKEIQLCSKTFGLPAGARWRRVYPAAAVSAGVDVSADPNHITGKCNANVPFNLKLSINKQIEECQRKCNRNWNAFQACRLSSARSKKDETKCRSHRDCHCNLAKFGNKGSQVAMHHWDSYPMYLILGRKSRYHKLWLLLTLVALLRVTRQTRAGQPSLPRSSVQTSRHYYSAAAWCGGYNAGQTGG